MSDPFAFWRGIQMVAGATCLLLNSKPLDLIVERLLSDNRCPDCGYRRDHPIVGHAYPWAGHLE